MALPKFEGRTPTGATVEIIRRSDESDGAYSIGEDMCFVVMGTVSKIVHEGTADGIKRVHKIKLDRVYRVQYDDVQPIVQDQIDADEEARREGEAGVGATPLPLQ